MVLDNVVGKHWMMALVGNLKMYEQARGEGLNTVNREHGDFHEFGVLARHTSDPDDEADHKFYLAFTQLTVPTETEELHTLVDDI
jgi:hypothetical protein